MPGKVVNMASPFWMMLYLERCSSPSLLATCHANLYLLQAMQPENHDNFMIQGVRLMEMYNNNSGAEHSLTNQVLTRVTHVLTNNSLLETQNVHVSHESPILEPYLAMLMQETCEISIPYEMYLAFLAIVLQGYVAQHQTDENNSKTVVLLSYLETVTEKYCK